MAGTHLAVPALVGRKICLGTQDMGVWAGALSSYELKALSKWRKMGGRVREGATDANKYTASHRVFSGEAVVFGP
jgi:hypothetical protein